MWDVDLSDRVSACLRRWRLRPVGVLSGGFRSEVLGCVTADGDEVVLKLTVTSREARREAAALSAWTGMGAVPGLLDTDDEHDALLLERVRPGSPLPDGDDRLAAGAVAGLLRVLHQVIPADAFPSLQEVYLRMEARARDDNEYERRDRGDPARGAAGLERLGAARASALTLAATAGRTVLLHGDFLAKNLVWNGTGYLAIDPIPCIGDPCSDAGFFAAGHPPAATILQRAALIADQSNLDSERVRRWAAVWAVLQSCQAWRDDQSDLDTQVASAEFERLLRLGCASISPVARSSSERGPRFPARAR